MKHSTNKQIKINKVKIPITLISRNLLLHSTLGTNKHLRPLSPDFQWRRKGVDRECAGGREGRGNMEGGESEKVHQSKQSTG